MHPIQEKIIALSKDHDITSMGYRKVGQMVNVDHPQQVKHHIIQLIKRGYLNTNKSSNVVNNIKAAGIAQLTFTKIPVYGSANCGTATFIAEDRIEGYIKVSNSLLRSKNVIALRAMGTSLNRADINGLAIEEGDFVLVDTNKKNPRNGEYVLSIIEREANIKKFMIKGNQIALLSESSESDHHPIYISESDNYLIGGVVTQVIKNQ